jgi:LPXTG-site transpeptidase (sortase) family protein
MAGKGRGAAPVLRILERVLLVIGLVCIAWYGGVRITAAREQSALSQDLDRLARVGATTGHAAPAARSVIGRIEVARVKLSAVAREGVDAGTLRLSAGHIPGTALPGETGNAGFAAHRDTFFRPLQSVRKGDVVTVTTPGGVYRYTVTGTRVVDPEDVSVLDATPGTVLTLVTCYPFAYVGSAPQRFIVRAALEPAGPPRSLLKH